MKKYMVSKHILSLLVVAVSILCAQTIFSQRASAAYEAGRILDDGVLLDARSMNPGQVQSFLNSRGGQIASKSFMMNCDAAGQQAKQIYQSIGAPCGHAVSAANIIYYSAQVYGISPKVIMATMQKEQSLITATNPTDRQYSQAMGYACPTSGNCSDSSNFFWQIDNGAWVLRYHFERARGNMNWWNPSSTWTCGTEKNLYKPNLYPGQNVRFYDTNGTHYATIYIQNSATSSFYCYTPHAYNNPQGLYGRAPYGSTGLYYSGSYNFVTFFESWFGSTKGNSFVLLDTPRFMQIKNNGTRKVDVFSGQQIDDPLSSGQQIKFVDKIYINNTWYLRTEFNYKYGGSYGIPQSQLTDIPYTPITPKLVTFARDGWRSIPAAQVSSGDHLPKDTSVKVVEQMVVNNKTYYRTAYNHDQNENYGISSEFLTDFAPLPLETPRNFSATRDTTKIHILTGQNTNIPVGTTLFFTRKTIFNGAWHFQAQTDNGTGLLVNSENLSESIYIPFEDPRVMVLNRDTYRIDPFTKNEIDLLKKGRQITLSTKTLLDGQWYYRTQYNTLHNEDMVIPASSFSEL